MRPLDLGGLALGDVGDHCQRAHVLPTGVMQRTRRQERPNGVAVLGAQWTLKLLADALSAKCEAALRHLDRRRLYEVEHRLAKQLLRLVAEHLCEGAVCGGSPL